MTPLGVFLLMVLIALYAIFIPLYKRINPAGFPFYLAWVLFVGIIWIFIVIPALS